MRVFEAWGGKSGLKIEGFGACCPQEKGVQDILGALLKLCGRNATDFCRALLWTRGLDIGFPLVCLGLLLVSWLIGANSTLDQHRWVSVAQCTFVFTLHCFFSQRVQSTYIVQCRVCILGILLYDLGKRPP